jgi:hypothetical protein
MTATTMMGRASAKWEAIKPMVFALAIGLVAGPVISNWAGWQVTSGSAQKQLRAGLVDLDAKYCEVAARADVSEPSKLDWSARSELAKKWSVMPGSKTADYDVTSACAMKLAG